MTESDLPLPLPLLLAVIALLGTIAGALIAAFSKRWRTPTDDREDRKIGIEADERLLKRFEDMLKERDDKLESLENKFEKLTKDFEEVKRERTILVDFVYELVRIIRDLGGLSLIPFPPRGIYISGHPSNNPQDQEATT
jgi:Txe/YoeB family toxin of Txe-Axe toxin-antitoxin module